MSTRSEGKPHDRLTQIGNSALDHIRNDPEYQDERVIVMLQNDEKGGIAIGGYESDSEAMTDMFMHLKAIFEANGKTLSIVAIPERGYG